MIPAYPRGSNRLVRTAMMAGLLLSFFACNPGGHWHRYSLDDSPFEFSCPGKFLGEHVGSLVAPEGVIESRYLLCTGEVGSFSVSYGRLSADLLNTFSTEEILEAALGVERMHDLGFREQSRAPVNVAGYTGLSATFIGGRGEDLTDFEQVTVIEGTLYKLGGVIGTPEGESAQVRRFFDSFRTDMRSN